MGQGRAESRKARQVHVHACMSPPTGREEPAHPERDSFGHFRALSPSISMRRKGTERGWMNDGARAAPWAEGHTSQVMYVGVSPSMCVCVHQWECVFVFVCVKETFWEISQRIAIPRCLRT